MKEIMPKLEKAFGDWQKADVPAFSIPAAPAQAESKIYLIDRPGSVQTVLQLGTLGIERTSPDYFAVLAGRSRVRRWSIGTTVPEPARGQRLHLRSVQRFRWFEVQRHMGVEFGSQNGSH